MQELHTILVVVAVATGFQCAAVAIVVVGFLLTVVVADNNFLNSCYCGRRSIFLDSYCRYYYQ